MYFSHIPHAANDEFCWEDKIVKERGHCYGLCLHLPKIQKWRRLDVESDKGRSLAHW